MSKELNTFCNYVLELLGNKKPKLSMEITKALKGSKLGKLEKKFEKIRMLKNRDPHLFENIINELNKSENKGPVSAHNFFSKMEETLTNLHYNGEITGGNFRDL